MVHLLGSVDGEVAYLRKSCVAVQRFEQLMACLETHQPRALLVRVCYLRGALQYCRIANLGYVYRCGVGTLLTLALLCRLLLWHLRSRCLPLAASGAL